MRELLIGAESRGCDWFGKVFSHSQGKTFRLPGKFVCRRMEMFREWSMSWIIVFYFWKKCLCNGKVEKIVVLKEHVPGWGTDDMRDILKTLRWRCSEMSKLTLAEKLLEPTWSLSIEFLVRNTMPSCREESSEKLNTVTVAQYSASRQARMRLPATLIHTCLPFEAERYWTCCKA